MRKILLIAMLLFSSAALAEPYVFASALSDVDFKAETSAGNFSDSSSALLYLGGGYRFNKYIAAEAAFLKPADFEHMTSTTQAGVTTQNLRTWDVTAFGVSAVASLPLGNYFSVFARAGAYWVSTEARRQEAVNNGVTIVLTANENVTESEIAPGIGIGAQLAVSSFRLRLLFEQIRGRDAFESIKIGTLQAGIAF